LTKYLYTLSKNGKLNSVDAVPRWRELTHFASFMNIDFNDGSKWADLSKVRTHCFITRLEQCCRLTNNLLRNRSSFNVASILSPRTQNLICCSACCANMLNVTCMSRFTSRLTLLLRITTQLSNNLVSAFQ
jgi:hypothetical protein